MIAVACLVAAWLVMQIADTALAAADIPSWIRSLVCGVLVTGSVVALALAFRSSPDDAGPGRNKKKKKKHVAAHVELPKDKSVAVLPFTDLSAADVEGYFADGMAEELLRALSKARGLRVAPRKSCFALKGKDLDTRTTAGRLHVAYLVRGSVKRSEDGLSVTGELIDADQDSVLWTETYDRQPSDIFAIEKDIARQVADNLQVTLHPADFSDATTSDPQAYDCFLRGRDYYRRQGLTDLAHAVTMYTRAVEHDPGFTRAWIDLAFTYAQQVIYFEGGAAERTAAYEAADKAVALAPGRGDSHAAMGVAHLASERHEDAVEELEKAIALEPTLWDALYFYGRVAIHQGNIAKAIEYFERAAAVNPDDYESPALAAGLGKGLVDEAVQQRLARQAVERVERQVEDFPDNSRALYLGAGALLTLGQENRARRWARRALDVDPNDPAIRYNLGCFYARAGDPDKAFECLRDSITSRSWIENDADLDSLREDPRYQRLLDRLDAE